VYRLDVEPGDVLTVKRGKAVLMWRTFEHAIERSIDALATLRSTSDTLILVVAVPERPMSNNDMRSLPILVAADGYVGWISARSEFYEKRS
jgi:hypothetical protein